MDEAVQKGAVPRIACFPLVDSACAAAYAHKPLRQVQLDPELHARALCRCVEKLPVDGVYINLGLASRQAAQIKEDTYRLDGVLTLVIPENDVLSIASTDIRSLDDKRLPTAELFHPGILAAFKLHPEVHGYATTDDLCLPIYEYANEQELPILSHIWQGEQVDGQHPMRGLAQRYPDATFIHAHSATSWSACESLTKADLEDMLARAKQAGIQVVIASCFGQRDYLLEENVEFGPERYGFAERIWRMEQQLCQKYGCFYVPNMQIDIKPNGKGPYWDDNIHPSKEGNRFVAKRILAELKKALKAFAKN